MADSLRTRPEPPQFLRDRHEARPCQGALHLENATKAFDWHDLTLRAAECQCSTSPVPCFALPFRQQERAYSAAQLGAMAIDREPRSATRRRTTRWTLQAPGRLGRRRVDNTAGRVMDVPLEPQDFMGWPPPVVVVVVLRRRPGLILASGCDKRCRLGCRQCQPAGGETGPTRSSARAALGYVPEAMYAATM